MPHMVSAFVQANRMVFAQVKTDGKGKELSAIEQLLEMLDLNGAVVAIDALGCNMNIAEKILVAGRDYRVRQTNPTYGVGGCHYQTRSLPSEISLRPACHATCGLTLRVPFGVRVWQQWPNPSTASIAWRTALYFVTMPFLRMLAGLFLSIVHFSLIILCAHSPLANWVDQIAS